jgi:hypothetical protein
MRAVVLRSYVVPLASAAIEAFFDRGYLVLPKTFGQGTVERFRRAFTRLERLARTLDETSLCKGSLFVLKRSEPEQVRIDRIVWCGGAEPILGRLGRSPKLVGVAAELLGGPELDQLVKLTSRTPATAWSSATTRTAITAATAPSSSPT